MQTVTTKQCNTHTERWTQNNNNNKDKKKERGDKQYKAATVFEEKKQKKEGRRVRELHWKGFIDNFFSNGHHSYTGHHCTHAHTHTYIYTLLDWSFCLVLHCSWLLWDLCMQKFNGNGWKYIQFEGRRGMERWQVKIVEQRVADWIWNAAHNLSECTSKRRCN